MVAITLPDGSVRRFDGPVTGTDIAESISKSLAKKAIAMRVDGALTDLFEPVARDATVEIVTRDDPQALELVRHDAAHLLAQAVQELYPGTQVTIGPVIEDGFYYDFARDEPFSSDDLERIETRMAEIVDEDRPTRKEVWDREEAIRHFKKIGETYKAEIIADLPEGEEIKIYWHGDWHDLCRGPHLPSTKHIGKAFKLMKVAGAYWRGDHRNPMLQRIYGTAWLSEKDLKAHLQRLDEAEKRDHRRLGRELGLFHFQPEAQGSVFWHPKGYMIWRVLEAYIRRRQDEDGYVEVKTPQLLDSVFWEKSGHWSKFRENMFVVPDEIPSTEEGKPVLSGEAGLMALKPMNCPAHVQIFKQGVKSYRDLPIRMAEFGCCHRNEAHGGLHGLLRVRQMTQDDAHIFCREDQITDETKRFLALFARVYDDMGLSDIRYKLATRPENRAGEDAVWDRAEKALADALTASGLDFDYAEGEGAFYGPKLEFHLTDAIGRTWQAGTFQLDYVLPERLDASYVDETGAKRRPVMLHRAVLGTFERFIGLLIEHYAGRLPLWLAPVQVVVATITSEADDYAKEAAALLAAKGLRVETDLRNEKINYKVREHSHAKVPAIAVVGAREADERKVSLRRLGAERQEVLDLDEAAARLGEEATPPDLRARKA
ncbi:threonine--tRNA ligase [Amphiplicatus metriothermophilus]|uniref:Threonine--tRNA ligase n=1 Tax=Amphiplicatus metriothermophilus TaxID=1519374 RepID=A0A239PK11_9PROT|nr:threonine--tRNA ligase [Amphiplicatus metriothermophilus]MBB5517776.1 threonyl-tRNA synthetase [Amphiplicatus metriothermophilus]SNT67890.1 threonyl-tRNA synthetase [Amphiplicatus metriothermophilus]